MRATLTWAATALMMAASAVTAGAQTPTEINFGVISTEASMNQKKNWEPFLQAMSKATGLKVNGFYATDYAGVIEAMRFNKIHLAWYGNKSGMEAVDRANGEVFAHIVARDGSVGYYSHVIAHKDSPFAKIDADSDIKTAKGVLADLIWSPFRPSSDSQLIPIRVLEANKNLMKAQADEKLSADEKARQVAAIRAEIEKLEEMQKKAESDRFQKRAAAFVEADKAGNQDELNKMIAEFAAGSSSTH